MISKFKHPNGGLTRLSQIVLAAVVVGAFGGGIAAANYTSTRDQEAQHAEWAEKQAALQAKRQKAADKRIRDDVAQRLGHE